MSSEGGDSVPSEGLLKTAEDLLRKAVGQYGLQHPIVIERLKLYVDLMQRSGKGDQVKELEEQAKLLQQKMRLPEPSDNSAAADTRPTTPASPMENSSDPEANDTASDNQDQRGVAAQAEVETHLRNSKGKHIATQVGRLLYTPSGRYLASWLEDLEVFVDKRGWYIGRIIDDNRLERETNWKFRNINFGKQSSAGDLPGWNSQPDIDYFQLSPGCEDVKLDESGVILDER